MIQASEFDTRLLGAPVGKVRVSGLEPKRLAEIRTEADAQKFAWVFIRDDAFPFHEAHRLDWRGLELTDVKLTLSANTPTAAEGVADFLISREANSGDLPALRKIVREIAKRSRFYRCFGEAKAFALYDAWLENSLSGQAADACFIARAKKSGAPVGLITVKKSVEAGASSPRSAEMTLVAVAPEARGHGVAKQLVAAVFEYARAEKIPEITVGSQLENRDAIRFYNSVGFKQDSVITDLHLRPLQRP